MSLVCLAFLAQLVFASATSADSCPAAICGSSELGSSDDTQVLLQTPKAVEIKEHSEQHGPEGFGFKVTPSDFENSMTFTAVVAVGGKIQGQGDLLSFVGKRLQGVSATPLVNPAHGFGGKYGSIPVYHLMTYGHGTAPGTKSAPDDGKPVTFKFLTKDGDFLDLKPALSAQTYKGDGTVGNAKEPLVLTAAGAAQEDTGSTCADVSQKDMNAFLATFGAGYDGLTCAQFKGWKQCNVVKGKCDKTCGECQ